MREGGPASRPPRIFLIQAQEAPEEGSLRREGWYLPLGLLSIATTLAAHGFRSVAVLDAQHDPVDAIVDRIATERPVAC